MFHFCVTWLEQKWRAMNFNYFFVLVFQHQCQSDAFWWFTYCTFQFGNDGTYMGSGERHISLKKKKREDMSYSVHALLQLFFPPTKFNYKVNCLEYRIKCYYYFLFFSIIGSFFFEYLLFIFLKLILFLLEIFRHHMMTQNQGLTQ